MDACARAGVLADLGFLTRDQARLLGSARAAGRGGGGGGADLAAWMSLPLNAGSDNARFLKAAVMAGFYPSVLRVQHPKTTYIKVRRTGAAGGAAGRPCRPPSPHTHRAAS